MLIVNNLVKLDVVEKTQGTRDKRIFYIKLTKKGRNIAQLPFLAEQRVVDIGVSVLNDEEIDTFIKKTAKIAKINAIPYQKQQQDDTEWFIR